jgi:N-formylglutamate deformylase
VVRGYRVDGINRRATLQAVQEPFVIVHEGEGPIVATAIHDGHALRPECAARISLDEVVRLREEDPYTARIAAVVPTRLIATRSRFEVDLNRPRDKAVYVSAEDAWGLEVWRDAPPADLIARSLAEYDAYYATLERVLRDCERRYGRFVVLDVHSYNHCRDGAGCDAEAEANPVVNLGTGTVDRARWGPLVDRFRTELAAAGQGGRPLDVRENVKFKGGQMSRWIHQSFPTTGCALALEFKKTFMDEWSGVVDDAHVAELARAVAATLPGLVESLGT